MENIDHWITTFGHGPTMILVVAFLLGLRHATDPDHLTAVSTLVLSDDRTGGRRATMLGFSWGLGHATSLFALGLPLVVWNLHLPDAVQRGAEATIGLIIIYLAIRLLLRWRRGYFHMHAHTHAGTIHVHPHVHEPLPAAAHGVHQHQHPADLGRSPLGAYGIGLMHGVGGSAGVGLLLLANVQGQGNRALVLLLFAGATAISMALLSTAFGYALIRGVTPRRLARVAPVFGVCSLIFGVWYAVDAIKQ